MALFAGHPTKSADFGNVFVINAAVLEQKSEVRRIQVTAHH
jgi:hypothetical protein